MDRRTGRQTDKYKDMQAGDELKKQAYRQTDKQAGGQSDRLTGGQMDKHGDRQASWLRGVLNLIS
jgi:hypothetical protein